MANARRYLGPIDNGKSLITEEHLNVLDDKYLLLENAFLNFTPKTGLADDEQIEIYAKPNFTFLPTMCNDFVWMDNQSRYIMYFLAHDGISYHHNMFRGYAYNLNDTFIFDNEPSIPSFINTSEYIGRIHCVTHDSIVFSTYLKSNKSYSKTYFVNTKGSSKANTWSEYVDITSIATYASTFVACFKNNDTYIAVYKNDTKVSTVLFDSSLTKIPNSDKDIFDIMVNIDYTGIPNFVSLVSFTLLDTYASYNVFSNELIISFKTIIWYVDSTSTVNKYLYSMFWFNYNIHDYITSNGSTAPVNTRLSDLNTEVYNHQTESKGRVASRYVIKLMYDIYSKTYRMNIQDPWNYGGPLLCREYAEDWDFNYSNNVLSTHTLEVLDASPWAKNITSQFYFIDDNETYQGDNCGTIIFKGRSVKYEGEQWIIAKVSSTDFNTIANSSLNSLKIKPGGWRLLSDVFTADKLALLQSTAISTYIPLSTHAASRYISSGAVGDTIYLIQRNSTNVFEYDFVDTGKIIPAIASYDSSIPVNWQNNYQIYNNFAGYNPDQDVVYFYVYKNITDPGVDAGYEKVCRIMKVRLSDNKAIAISGYIGADFKNNTIYNDGTGFIVYNSLIVNNNTEDTYYTTISYSVPGSSCFRPYRINFLNQDDIISFINNNFSRYHGTYFSYCKNLGVIYICPTSPASVNNGYINIRTEELVTSDVSLSTINLAMSCISSVGLVMTIPSFYVFIGGFMTRSEAGEYLLSPNTRTYVCIEKDFTDPKNLNRKSKIVLYDYPVPNSFSRICIGEIVTNSTDIVEQIIYAPTSAVEETNVEITTNGTSIAMIIALGGD